MTLEIQPVISIETRDGDRWLSKRQVCKIVGMSAETIRTRELAGKFIKRFYLSPVCVRFSERELDAWMAEQMKSCRREDVRIAA